MSKNMDTVYAAMEIEAWANYKRDVGFEHAQNIIDNYDLSPDMLNAIKQMQSIGTADDTEMIGYLEVCFDEMANGYA